MEQERTSTYLYNSKTKRQATNDVKIVVNPVCQAFNTTCGVYQRWSFCFLRHKQPLYYLVWDKTLWSELGIWRLKFEQPWSRTLIEFYKSKQTWSWNYIISWGILASFRRSVSRRSAIKRWRQAWCERFHDGSCHFTTCLVAFRSRTERD